MNRGGAFMGNNDRFSMEPMLEMFLFETNQLLEQLEDILINSEDTKRISEEDVNEIFRIMHTIKGSSSMMMFSGIATITHALEDLFQSIRESHKDVDSEKVCDFSLRTADFVKNEINKIQNGMDPNGDSEDLAQDIRSFLSTLKEEGCIPQDRKPVTEKQRYYISADKSQRVEKALDQYKYAIKIHFDEDCQMESIRAYTVIHNIKDHCAQIYHRPVKLLEDEFSSEYIKSNGLDLYITTGLDQKEVIKEIDEALFVKSYEISLVEDYMETIYDILESEIEGVKETLEIHPQDEGNNAEEIRNGNKGVKSNIINVNLGKLDKLMDLVGEIVITEAMVTRNPDLNGMELENFSKSARQLRKLTDELQDIVMSIRMIPVASIFQKMKRVIRDMSKNLQKDVQLIIEGEDTEVDKNIIDNLSDPLMHIIRNSMDHGIEDFVERQKSKKNPKAQVKLQAQNTGGEVLITIEDDGRGLNKEKILQKARENGILTKAEEELTDKDIYSLVLIPGFSTKESITEYSGRGVGMDVVKKNIDKLGGSISIDSVWGKGTTVNIRIPLTLAIVDGMEIAVGESVYTIPTISIKESFKTRSCEVFEDTEGNEMIMIRGKCFSVVRLHELFQLSTRIKRIEDGIMVMVEQEGKSVLLFADELLGEQQVVVKPIPLYLSEYALKEKGIGGCTILGDGSISLILDIPKIIERVIH